MPRGPSFPVGPIVGREAVLFLCQTCGSMCSVTDVLIGKASNGHTVMVRMQGICPTCDKYVYVSWNVQHDRENDRVRRGQGGQRAVADGQSAVHSPATARRRE